MALAKTTYDVTSVNVGKCLVHLMATIKGLVSERRIVRQKIDQHKPEAIAIPVSAEGLRGLRAIHRGKQLEFFLSHYEEIYAIRLSRYGKVIVPPPSYTEALEYSLANKLPIKAIDLDEEDFASAFTENVSSMNLVYHSVRWRWLKRRKFEFETPEEFAMAWDRTVNSLKGFKNLEQRREEHMALQIRRLGQKYRTLFAIIELERMDGVLRRLREGAGGAVTSAAIDIRAPKL